MLPWISYPGVDRLDLTEQLANPGNILLMVEGGGIFFFALDAGLYELHTNFLPGHRGRYALRASQAAYRWMFTRTDCMALVTKVPAFNRGADIWARAAGFTCEFERAACWPTAEGMCGARFYALRYDDWVRKTPALADSGRIFHDRIDQEFARHGKLDDRNHPDDECHHRHVGVAMEMVYGGQPEKAAVLYNRWAAFSGYGQVALVSRNPLLIDIGDALLQVGDGTFKVIKCR